MTSETKRASLRRAVQMLKHAQGLLRAVGEDDLGVLVDGLSLLVETKVRGAPAAPAQAEGSAPT
jgi:hypothetical protein